MASIVKPGQVKVGDSPQHLINGGQPVEPNVYLQFGPVRSVSRGPLGGVRFEFADGTELGPFSLLDRIELLNR